MLHNNQNSVSSLYKNYIISRTVWLAFTKDDQNLYHTKKLYNNVLTVYFQNVVCILFGGHMSSGNSVYCPRPCYQSKGGIRLNIYSHSGIGGIRLSDYSHMTED